ncbi:HNH endonuclease [Xanthomonas campestris pv. campestris]|uniref:HNH endonuclease n=1 Tax=Xanthomonas campestris TaxID=339 RepID=UPI001E45F7A6|nr:HNH endonuclease [Xanthomonas campestris]MCC5068823.1 HNH endonuclease [Xanthomonas campestris]MEB1549815.1 HNH endonuclease [Xanthomonas campestris pv. campestris]MEB1554492.1 HNH endonuclease [Xanthomonas campestris pv. campestris]
MIALFKTAEPAILAKKGHLWTEELLRKIAAGEKITEYLLTRYSHPEVKAALILETNGKCAYCESAFTHVTFGDVEHIVPKSVDPSLRFSWPNLTIACDICNQKKSNRLDVLDPYVCDPEELFNFHGPLMWAAPSSDAAKITEEVLELNRPGLVERRKERMELIRRLLDSADGKSEPVKQVLIERAWREVHSSQPFSACGKSLLKKLLNT